jgi:hypothetical protein
VNPLNHNDLRRSTMIVRLTLAAVVCFLAAVGGAATAMSATPKPTSCGTASIAGAPWVIVVLRVPCSSAVSLLRKLAAKPLPGGSLHAYPGTYLGLQCHRNPTPKPGITCGMKGVLKFIAGVKKS